MSFRGLGFLGFDGRGERRERRVPHLVQVLAHGGDAVRVHALDATSSFGPVDDEPGVLEHPQVLGDRRPAHGEGIGELADGPGPADQELEDGAASRITECFQRVARSFVSDHEP